MYVYWLQTHVREAARVATVADTVLEAIHHVVAVIRAQEAGLAAAIGDAWAVISTTIALATSITIEVGGTNLFLKQFYSIYWCVLPKYILQLVSIIDTNSRFSSAGNRFNRGFQNRDFRNNRNRWNNNNRNNGWNNRGNRNRNWRSRSRSYSRSRSPYDRRQDSNPPQKPPSPPPQENSQTIDAAAAPI